ncbi:collagen binding domain-containing protein [Lysinibacillus sp. FSL H8-0500]|uniref:collagen binding domain-containing protein n=1 Tax=Lysinibacillus sp. FSL H8-0500 TaxID=2921393 RepID=UPI003100FE40
MKKFNLAIIILLLVFQTILSPLSVLAAEGDPILPVENTDTGDTGSDPGDEAQPTNEAEPAGTETGDSSETEATEPSPPIDEEAGNDSEPVVSDEEGATDTEEGTDAETDEVTAPEEEQQQLDDPILPLMELFAAPADSMQGEVSMSFVNLILNGTPITNATDLANYSGPKPKKGDMVTLNYSFAVNPTKDYGVGSTFTFQLPENMIAEFTPGSFSIPTQTTPYASYSTTYDSGTKTVTVILDSEIEEAQVGNITFTFQARFGNFASEDELEQTLLIPIEGGTDISLSFEFAPTGNQGNLLTKSAGAITRNASGIVTIPWTVWVNTGGQKLTGASLNDTPDAKHALTGNITVERYKVGLNGFNPSSPGAPDAIDNTATTFPINLTDGHYAYKVTYNTVVTADPASSSESYTNTARLTGAGIPANTTANGTQSVQYGPSLDKGRTGDKYKSTWTIKYNWLGQKIPADQATLTDVLTGQHSTTGKHKIDYTSFQVYRVTLSNDGQTEQSSILLAKGADYTLTENAYDFEIDFDRPSNTTGPNGEVTSAFKIVYDTELEDEFVTDANQGRVTNTVTRADGESDDAYIDLTPNIFIKSGGTHGTGGTTGIIDYVNKTIEWTLTIDAEKELRNFVIEDDFTTSNKVGDTLKHTLTQWSGSDPDFYKVTGIAASAYTITNKVGGAPVAGDEGFKVEFTNSIPAGNTVTIRYKTKFDIKPNGGVATSYINTANATWDGLSSNDNRALNRTRNYQPDPTSPTNNNGYKNVNVNNNTQEFAWRVGININKQDIDGATLTDILGPGHYIPVPDGETLKEQITITRLNLTSEAGTTIGQPQLDSSKWSIAETLTGEQVTGFVITFTGLDSNENNEAYLIEYKTKDADDIYGQSGGNPRQYTNSAELATPHNGDYPYNATATISNRANELITKSANVVPADDIINWTVTINASNSQLGNITLTDKPSANQKVLTNTFNKQEIKLNASGTSQNVGGLIPIAAEDIVLNPDGSFSLDLGELNGKGYIVTYSTFFMGDGNTGETVTNEASIGYAGASVAGTTDSNHGSGFFQYSVSETGAEATKGTVRLNKFKVNPLTGVREVFEGVKFELWNKTNTIKLDEGITDVNGIVEFEQVRYGKYTLREVTPTGYENVSAFEVTMKAEFDILVGGNPYVVENIEQVDLTNACPKFTITVNDANGDPLDGKDITLFDSNGEEVAAGTTSNGQFRVKRPGTGGLETAVPAGLYTVEVKDGTDVITLENAEITVKYGNGECQAEVQQANACPEFTITINDDNNNPRANVTVTLKDSSNATVATETTGNDGKFTLPSTTPAGTYKVYEGNQYLGTVTIDYTNGCEAALTVARACETFTLMINDVDGKPRANIDIEIVDKQDPAKTFTGTTNANGVVVFDNLPATGLPPADYLVYEDGVAEPIDEFAVDINCEHTVQPAPACSAFTLTVKDEDGILPAGTEVTITNPVTGDSFTRTVGENGEVTFPSATTPAGQYAVTITETGKSLGTFNLTYTNGCTEEVELPRACTIFTITVKDSDGSLKENTQVIIEDSTGNVVTTATGQTDGNGEIQLPANQAPGMYTVYEVTDNGAKGDRIGEVKVTYTAGCKGEVQKNACPNYTLTVNDYNLQPVGANVKVTIQNQAGEVVASGITNTEGKIVFEDKTKLQQGQIYAVYNEAGSKLGDITVSYVDNICGATVQIPYNACPIFTLTIQDLYGRNRPNVEFTIKDLSNNTIATGRTNEHGVGTIPYTVGSGTYRVYEGSSLIDTIIVTDACSALAKPSYTGGGGGSIPPNPVDPTNPDPNNPDPNKPDPNQPVDPDNPDPNKPDPNKPVDPDNPDPNKPDPNKPLDPNNPDPNKPDPNNPNPNNPDPNQPVDPSNPGPNNSVNPTNPTPGPSNPSASGNGDVAAQDVINQGKQLPSYNPSNATRDTLEAYQNFLNNYNKLSKEEQALVAQAIDIDQIKADAKRLEALLRAQGKLPQTDGANQTALVFVGLLLVIGAVLLMRRRHTES